MTAPLYIDVGDRIGPSDIFGSPFIKVQYEGVRAVDVDHDLYSAAERTGVALMMIRSRERKRGSYSIRFSAYNAARESCTLAVIEELSSIIAKRKEK